MLNRNANSPCYVPDCLYNIPAIKPHIHVQTSNGHYVRYIIEKPKQKQYDEI
jgi:hypothetical protein